MMSTPRVLNDGTALSINNGAMPAWNKQVPPLPQRSSRRTSEALLVDRGDATRRVLNRDTAFLSRLVEASREGILECVPTEPRERAACGKDPLGESAHPASCRGLVMCSGRRMMQRCQDSSSRVHEDEWRSEADSEQLLR